MGRKAVGEGEDVIARLFIETQQFSERVAGIDIWRKPVLPWIKPTPNSWLPESFGLRIGDPPDAKMLPLAAAEIEPALKAAECAVREEQASFLVADVEVPATQATVEALRGLEEIVNAVPEAGDREEDTPPENLRQRYFLQVRDNLEEVAFAPLADSEDHPEFPPATLPDALRTSPKPHQIDGFQWLTSSWQAHTPGILLADDMGLGKTWQALAFLAWMRQQEPKPKPILIVAPTGLLMNWRNEIARHLEPDALGRVVSAFGGELARLRQGSGRDIDSGSAAIDPAAWAGAGLVLTTYEAMRDYHLSFARQPFSVILYDEAQKLKNPASQLTRAAKTLNARFNMALTGTPVENRLQDLWSIFDVIHPGLLGASKTFEQTWSTNPDKLRDLHAKLTLPADNRPPVLLRRMKDECLESLPAKRIEAMPVPMPPRQAAAYDRAIARALAVKGTGERGRMLEVLHQLRGISLHPVSPHEAGGDETYFADSARLTAVFTVLDRIADSGEKALIFCESLAMQALLAAELRRRYKLPHAVFRIHGGVTGPARQAAVDAFQERPPGFDVMLISPKAGGVGLTLTAANHVIHLSRWWNPAVEDQATDRAFRIGQTRDVTVYLPQAVHPDASLAPTSFDLKLHELIERKRELSRGLLAPGEEAADADCLFDTVIHEIPEAAEPEPISAPDEIGLHEAADEPASPGVAEVRIGSTDTAALRPQKEPRRRLTLRPRPSEAPPLVPAGAPPLATQAKPAWPRRVVYEEGGRRDYTIFTAPVADDPVRELIIIDPYGAAGDRARRCTVDFARMLLGNGSQGIEGVRLITFDAEDVGTLTPESSDHQYADMHDRWHKTFRHSVPLRFEQHSRRGNRQLHDREVRARTRSGRNLIWDIGHGLDGVMTARFRCTVVLTEE